GDSTHRAVAAGGLQSSGGKVTSGWVLLEPAVAVSGVWQRGGGRARRRGGGRSLQGGGGPLHPGPSQQRGAQPRRAAGPGTCVEPLDSAKFVEYLIEAAGARVGKEE